MLPAHIKIELRPDELDVLEKVIGSICEMSGAATQNHFIIDHILLARLYKKILVRNLIHRPKHTLRIPTEEALAFHELVRRGWWLKMNDNEYASNVILSIINHIHQKCLRPATKSHRLVTAAR